MSSEEIRRSFGTETYRDKSSSLPFLSENIEHDKSYPSSFIKNVGVSHTQSSDSLLSLDQNTSLNLDSGSQISLPELGRTLTESEGYASFRSNLSSTSSPWSSSQNSPTSEDSQLEGSLESAVDDKCATSTGTDADADQTENLDYHAKHISHERALDSLPLLFSESIDKDCVVKKHCIENIEKMKKETVAPLSLNLEKRMSTIDESLEEMPSPRSAMDIDRDFTCAYKRLVDKRVLATESKLQKDDRLSENIIISSEIKARIIVENELDDNESRKGCSIANISASELYQKDQATTSIENVLCKIHDGSRLFEGDGDNQNIPSATKSKRVEGILCNTACSSDVIKRKSAEETVPRNNLALLNEQAFDIDLDLYEIPQQRRKSLEMKLNQLRKFVDRIIEDRKFLEEDRQSLRKTLQAIKSQEYALSQEDAEERFVNTKRSDEEKCSHEKENDDDLKESESIETSNIPADHHVSLSRTSECSSQERQADCADANKDDLSLFDMDYEELLSSLEDALMENIGLKNENQDLTVVNDELRRQIEDLLTKEDELRYNMNTATLKLMEESERQKEENVVLRSNFNKVLRDYNFLEAEFKELEENYEELICERDLLVDELALKNEDYQLCKKDCTRLTEELESAKNQLEQYDMTETKIWTRADWENWSVLQTTISSTEKALFDARKQKAKLVADLKGMKKTLELGKQKIQEAETAMNNLENNLNRAHENNRNLKRENEELRRSISMYENRITDSEAEADCVPSLSCTTVLFENCQYVDTNSEHENDDAFLSDCEKQSEENESASHRSQLPSLDMMKGRNLVVLRNDLKAKSIRRARTFPANEMENLALRLCQETSTVVYAGSQYQNAFQEIGTFANEQENYADDFDQPLTMKALPRINQEQLNDEGNIDEGNCCGGFTEAESVSSCNSPENHRKLPHRYSCLPVRALLPSVIQALLSNKSKRGRRSCSVYQPQKS